MYQIYKDKNYIEFTYDLHEEMENQSLKIPFVVPEKVARIHIGIKVNKRGKNKIHWSINNGKEIVGESYVLRRTVFIDANAASKGFKPHIIEAGQWSLNMDISKLIEPCPLTIRIRFELEKNRWLKGDLHMHTTHSDGAFDVDEVMDHICDMELDFHALTDHNSFSQNQAFKPRRNLIVIPGVEYSSPKGDSNIWGLSTWEGHFQMKSEEDVESVLDLAKQRGALVSMNHPFIKNKPWKWSYDNFHCIEIWRGEWNTYNQKAVEYWQSRLVKGERIIGVGGSDIHDENQGRWYGLPTTAVKTDKSYADGILDAITTGAVCVLSGPKTPVVELQLGEVEMGQTYKDNAEDKEKDEMLTCQLSHGIDGEIRVITANGTLLKKEITKEVKVIKCQQEEKARFYRVELWQSGQPVCITNPIYVEV